MSIITPEIEIIDRSEQSLVYLEHGWPTKLCRWHAHEQYELHLILETRGKAFVGDYIGEFTPGSLFLTGPNLPHNWITDAHYKHPVENRDMLVQFSHRSMDRLISGFPEFGEINTLLELSQSGVEFINVDRELAIAHFAAFRDLKGPPRILKFLSFMSLLTTHPNKSVLSVVRIKQPETGARHQKIADVIDFIIKNYATDISVAKASSIAGMGSATFARNFQVVTGNRFVEFVNRIRIGQACLMLFETEEQVSSICYDVGFQNLANFNRHFLKIKFMTPSEYRKSARASLTLSADKQS